MIIKTYIIDAFAEQLFTGNPAAVCCLDEWLADTILQKIASENKQPVTAFIVKQAEYYDIRWFSVNTEMDLCGHGSLAAAYVITNHYQHPASEEIKFVNCVSGKFSAKILSANSFQLKCPAALSAPISFNAPQLSKIFKSKPKEIWYSDRFVAILDTVEDVLAFKPNLTAIKKMNGIGLVVTAQGKDCDFVSRYFTPKLNINEDAVTGSSHLTLAPIWAKKLGKNKLCAKQLSTRGGSLLCEVEDEHIFISAQAIEYSRGQIEL